MNDLAAILNSGTSETVKAIYAWHEARAAMEAPRMYLGASMIGHHCTRYLWYTFRAGGKVKHDGRLLRLFLTGHLEEPRFVEELRGIGCEVMDVGEDGNQIGFKALGGHFRGHCDGAALGIPEAPKTWHLLEMKTHSAKSFKDLISKGLRASKPMHYAQMQAYMGEMGLTRGLYMAKNKDTDEIYTERVRYDPEHHKSMIARAKSIITSVLPPERFTSDPSDYRCGWCDARELCWGTNTESSCPLASITCRTCCHATPETGHENNDGDWTCAAYLGDDARSQWNADTPHPPCEKHLLIPGLLPWATPTDSGENYIEFTNNDKGAVWRHGDGHLGTYSTQDLIDGTEARDGKQKPAPFGDDLIPTTLVECYHHEISRLVWSGTYDQKEVDAILREKLELKPLQRLPSPTRSEPTAKTDAREYRGSICVVIYKEHDNYAAIWEGIE